MSFHSHQRLYFQQAAREDGDLEQSGRIGSREDSTYSELLGIMCDLSSYNFHCNQAFGDVPLIESENKPTLNVVRCRPKNTCFIPR